MIDFDALWASDKLAACKESARVEYTWFYGLADAYGCFEINIAAIRSRVSSIRPKLSVSRITAILEQFRLNGLLFVWKTDKTYGFWTGSDKKGRLPPEGTRHRYKRFTPPVPIEALAEYESRFGRDSVATISRQGVGVGVGLDGLGDGEGSGERPPEAGRFGATATPAAYAAAISSPIPVSMPSSNSTATPPVNKKSNQTRARQRRFSCPDCEESFENAGQVMSHACEAKTAGGFECKWCHSTFKDHRGLKDHRSQCPQAV
ncbi:MAG: hypothetical protein WCC97_18650 [Candidatus Acidiferrales bacterium]